ncbi:MAG TPA: hypothetical protein VEF06_10740 [Bryobacteraceae bacterium]|nr:hypothetical protein [Bryobacteraceae bacterium]
MTLRQLDHDRIVFARAQVVLGQLLPQAPRLDPHVGFDQKLSQSQIVAAVNYLNANWAGKTDAHGNVFRPLHSAPAALVPCRSGDASRSSVLFQATACRASANPLQAEARFFFIHHSPDSE